MQSPPDRGSVLIADLVLGAAIVIAIASIASAFGILAGRQQDQREAARHAAVIAARTGDVAAAETAARRISSPSTVTIATTTDSVTVRVSASHTVPHPVLRRVAVEISAAAEVPIAPYRSDR